MYNTLLGEGPRGKTSANGMSLHRGILNGPDNRTTFYGATQAALALLAN